MQKLVISGNTGVQVCAGSLTVAGETAIAVTGQPQEKTDGDDPIADGTAVLKIAKLAHAYVDGKCTVCGTADPNYKPESKPETKPEDKPTTDIPQTGDNINMTLWIVLLLASMGGVVGTTVYARKRRYNR